MSHLIAVHNQREKVLTLPSVGAYELLTEFHARLEQLLPAANREPQRLHQAMRHALIGGKFLRPRLLFTVVEACSAGTREAGSTELAVLAACAVELVHSASLVHDDLPSFDNSPLRHGMPTVHARFGEGTAILTGDALIALAFHSLSQASAHLASRTVRIVSLLAHALGSAGMAGGQSMEGEEGSPTGELLARYHRMKTAALFRMAAAAGAIAAGGTDVEYWGGLGDQIGMALQLADDIYDACGQGQGVGKPVGRAQALGRPNAVYAHGEAAARKQLTELLMSIRNGFGGSTSGARQAWLDELAAA